MSWKTEHFRDPSYRERALRNRDNGYGQAHKSWPKSSVRSRTKESDIDPFDLWLRQVEHRVQIIMADARLGYLRAQEECDEIPF